MQEEIPVRVECYAGYQGDERPLRFHRGARCYEIVEVLAQWYGPDHLHFRVRADDGEVYLLRRGHPEAGDWKLIVVT